MIPIIDTHLHLIYPDRFAYPWLSGAPALNRPCSIEDYLAEARPLGIEAALHMEVDVDERHSAAESRFVTELDGMVGAIAGCRPESPDFERQLDELADIAGLRGLRRVLHRAPNTLSQTPHFVENIRRLAARDLTFDLCVRHDQLPIGQALVDSCPEVSFVLDHCGAQDITVGDFSPWREHIAEIARRPNLNAKISGIMAYAGKDWTLDAIRPYVEHVIEKFGWDRVVWGSDHPVVTLGGSLTDWVGATREIVKGTSLDEQAKLFNVNAKRIYRL